jgi:hypothetical protein
MFSSCFCISMRCIATFCAAGLLFWLGHGSSQKDGIYLYEHSIDYGHLFLVISSKPMCQHKLVWKHRLKWCLCLLRWLMFSIPQVFMHTYPRCQIPVAVRSYHIKTMTWNFKVCVPWIGKKIVDWVQTQRWFILRSCCLVWPCYVRSPSFVQPLPLCCLTYE